MKCAMKALTKIFGRQLLFGASDVVENENGVDKIWGPPVCDQTGANSHDYE